jgi:hypothetical protein
LPAEQRREDIEVRRDIGESRDEHRDLAVDRLITRERSRPPTERPRAATEEPVALLEASNSSNASG